MPFRRLLAVLVIVLQDYPFTGSCFYYVGATGAQCEGVVPARIRSSLYCHVGETAPSTRHGKRPGRRAERGHGSGSYAHNTHRKSAPVSSRFLRQCPPSGGLTPSRQRLLKSKTAYRI